MHDREIRLADSSKSQSPPARVAEKGTRGSFPDLLPPTQIVKRLRSEEKREAALGHLRQAPKKTLNAVIRALEKACDFDALRLVYSTLGCSGVCAEAFERMIRKGDVDVEVLYLALGWERKNNNVDSLVDKQFVRLLAGIQSTMQGGLLVGRLGAIAISDTSKWPRVKRILLKAQRKAANKGSESALETVESAICWGLLGLVDKLDKCIGKKLGTIMKNKRRLDPLKARAELATLEAVRWVGKEMNSMTDEILGEKIQKCRAVIGQAARGDIIRDI